MRYPIAHRVTVTPTVSAQLWGIKADLICSNPVYDLLTLVNKWLSI